MRNGRDAVAVLAAVEAHLQRPDGTTPVRLPSVLSRSVPPSDGAVGAEGAAAAARSCSSSRARWFTRRMRRAMLRPRKYTATARANSMTKPASPG